MNEYEYIISDTPSGPLRDKYNTYAYGELQDLPPHVLMLCCVAEAALAKTRLENLDIDAYAIIAILAGQPWIPTRAKPLGATKGTSLASVVCRALFDIDFKRAILPTLTAASIDNLRLSMVRNLGAFIGRTIPTIGWTVLAFDVVTIFANAIERYNRLVEPEDRIHDATVGSLG